MIRLREGSIPTVPTSAGRVCGSGLHCQHRCCHYPRRLSFVEEGSQRTSTRKVARCSTESAGPRLRFIRSASERGRPRPWKRGQSGPNGRLAVFSLILSSEGVVAEFIEFFRPLFRPEGPTKQFSCATKPFSVFGADVRKQPTVIRFPTRRRALPATDNRRQSDADHQLHPRLRLHPGWSLDGWFFRPAPAGRRYLCLSWLAGCERLRPSRWSWPPTERAANPFRKKDRR